MSEIRRAYDMLRGYVNREWDRMRSIEWSSAWQELEDSLRPPVPQGEEAAVAEEPTIPEGVDRKELACNILGVARDAEFEVVRTAFRRLHRRSDPSAFPPGSEESRNAARIQQRVSWAYTCLTADTNETERRFRSLEIE
ncbi:MAG: hypothetical protein IT207_00580 [Fimbriimonadaceae bacterium]|nr:hypothetical protein [Fimbriimonadaceae bacterium]